MNPERPNQLLEDKALEELKYSFDNLFKEFEKIVNNNNFLSFFSNQKDKTEIIENNKMKTSDKYSNYISIYIIKTLKD